MAAGGAPLYALMGVDAVSSIGTSYAQSKALRAKGSYEEGLANTNAIMAEMSGEQAIEAGDISASRKDLETKQKVGSVLATQGASGVDVASGSNAAVRNALNLVGTTDALTIRDNARRVAWGYKTQAMNDRYQGKFAQLTAKSESEQSLLEGGLKAIEGPLSIYAYKSRRSGIGNVPNSYINGDPEDLT